MPSWLRNKAEVRALEQAYGRVCQNIMLKADEDGRMSGELKALINEANDALVEVVHKFEGDRS
jgi:hypothetical protein